MELSVSITQRIGAKIRLHRTAKNWTQEELAEMIGSTASYIGQIERGEKNIRLDTVEKIITALDLSIEQLFDNEHEAFLQSKKWVWDSINLMLQQDERTQRKVYRVIREMLSEEE